MEGFGEEYGDAIQTLSLVPHPDGPPSAVSEIEVQIWAVSESRLHLRFIATGDMARMVWPDNAAPDRTNGLWHHSCFEVFRRTGDGPHYQEYNFSPSTAWAAYDFAAYRKGGKDLALAARPQIWIDAGHDWLALEVEVAVPALAAPWQFNLTAVIEETDGHKSYWALKHGDGAPDFHNPACFLFEVGAPLTR